MFKTTSNQVSQQTYFKHCRPLWLRVVRPKWSKDCEVDQGNSCQTHWLSVIVSRTSPILLLTNLKIREGQARCVLQNVGENESQRRWRDRGRDNTMHIRKRTIVRWSRRERCRCFDDDQTYYGRALVVNTGAGLRGWRSPPLLPPCRALP